MLSASQDFREKLIKGSPVYSKARITLTDGTIMYLDSKDFLFGKSGFRLNTATSNSSSFDIGACIVGQLDLKILNYNGQFDIYSFDKARVEVWVYMNLSGDSIEANKFISPSADIIDAGDVSNMENVTQIYDGSVFTNKHIESIKKGVFYVDTQDFNGGVVSLTCYDKLMAFNTDYTGSSVTMTASQWINELANRHGLFVKNYRFNNSTLELTLPTDKTYTDLQLLNYILQCTGNYAKINEVELMEISWYDVGKINSYNIIDAGNFTNPSTNIVDAGDVSDMENTVTIYSGGTFEERKDDKYIIHLFDSTIGIDDVVVTGVRTILDDDVSVLAGSEGYVLKIENNPFITNENQQDITDRLWSVCQGLAFRPMSITTLNDPLIQTGDVMQVQINGNTYTSFVTNISYTQAGHTEIQCSAESPTKNSTKIGSKPLGVDKKVNGIVDKRLTAYDIGVQMLTNLITQSMGLYETAEIQEDGSTIYIMHDKPNLSDSMKLWKMTADGFVVSNDGGVTWNSGWDINGNAVMNILSVIGINFDWAKGGTLTLGGANNANGVMNVLDSGRKLIAKLDVNGLAVDKGTISGNLVKGGTIIGANFQNAEQNPTFSVDNKGNIKGASISASKISTTNGSFSISDGDTWETKVGGLYCTNQSFGVSTSYGQMNAQKLAVGSGTIGGLTIGGAKILGTDYILKGMCGSGYWSLTDSIFVGNGSLGNYSNQWPEMYASYVWGNAMQCNTNMNVGGNFSVDGTKARVVNTKNYGKREMYAYETPTPMFGDIGEGMLDDEGCCYIYNDEIFSESIDKDTEYQVFLQPYGEGKCYVCDRQAEYFVVKGTPKMKFAWEIKAIQRDYNMTRTEEHEDIKREIDDITIQFDYMNTLNDSIVVDSELLMNEDNFDDVDELLKDLEEIS